MMMEAVYHQPSVTTAQKYKDRDDKTPAFGAAKEISTFID